MYNSIIGEKVNICCIRNKQTKKRFLHFCSVGRYSIVFEINRHICNLNTKPLRVHNTMSYPYTLCNSKVI